MATSAGESQSRGKVDTPILEELRVISGRPEHSDDVILIDDVRCFDGPKYMPLHELLSLAGDLGWRVAAIGEDILTLVPCIERPQ